MESGDLFTLGEAIREAIIKWKRENPAARSEVNTSNRNLYPLVDPLVYKLCNLEDTNFYGDPKQFSDKQQ